MPASHREAAMPWWVPGVERRGSPAALKWCPSCCALHLSQGVQLCLFFVFFFACMASNGILIVYIVQAATHSKVTVFPSPLPTSFLGFPKTLDSSVVCCIPRSVFIYLSFSLFTLSPILFPHLLDFFSFFFFFKAWMKARLEPQQGSAAQKELCHPVPRSCWAAILPFMSRWSALSINMAPR